MTEAVETFTIAVPEEVVDDLRSRLSSTRWPGEVNGSGWSYGTNLAYLRELCTYWRDRFDWRAQEAALNGLPQFTTTIGDQRLHFLHLRGNGPAPIPIVLTHGWPSSSMSW